MIEILIAEEFEKLYIKLPISIQKKAIKQQELFLINPFYTSLNTEKLEPKGKQLWSFRINKTYRIVFRFVDGNKVLSLTVGMHDWIYKIVGKF